MSEPTKRELNRVRTQDEILRVGREHLGTVGPAALSLRAVARDLGMVSSAIYRYVDSRDELLTRLIDDAYNSMADVVEGDAAATTSEPAAARWLSAARAIRSWSLDHPHEYSLLYGSPVPGYEAPELTTVSGTRVARALVGIVRDAVVDDDLERAAEGRSVVPEIPDGLADDFAALRTDVDLEVPNDVVLDILIAWSQLFGLLSFELFSQTRGITTQNDTLFDAAAQRMSDLIGLR